MLNRREFLIGTAAFAGWTGFGTDGQPAARTDYSVVLLGDTHFDTEPATVYHAAYLQKTDGGKPTQQKEFARNGKMWRTQCPKLLKRAAANISPDTAFALQLGDLVQGDCGDPAVHRKFLADALARLKADLGAVPLATVVGNHDIRGTGAATAYREFMPGRMSKELGKPIQKTTFGFRQGPDAWIFVDFNRPDDPELDRLLAEAKDARYTFVVSHGPIFPSDGVRCRWILHGGESAEETEKRRHFRTLFAARRAIVLCGHTHRLALADWTGDGGRITQFTCNSVWSAAGLAVPTVEADRPDQYGTRRTKMSNPDGSPVKDEEALFAEYRPGLTRYYQARAAGSCKLRISDERVVVDFFGGDAEKPVVSWTLRERERPFARKDVHVRDPFVLVENGVYHLYHSHRGPDGRAGVAVRTSTDLERWTEARMVATLPAEVNHTAVWAPEVHKYQDAYWLFTTLTFAAVKEGGDVPDYLVQPQAMRQDGFKGGTLQPRGVWVFRSDRPEGPFKPVKLGPVTPKEWMCLDGTLWVEDGVPWMVFCHEWCQTGNGRMMAAPMSADLTRFTAEPTELFRAAFKPGAKCVTDGPFLIRTPETGLRMIWSNFLEGSGYCVLQCRSASGKVAGPWSDHTPLYTQDGGHGMLFRKLDGQLVLSLHQPNGGGRERMHLYPIRAAEGGLVRTND